MNSIKFYLLVISKARIYAQNWKIWNKETIEVQIIILLIIRDVLILLFIKNCGLKRKFNSVNKLLFDANYYF